MENINLKCDCGKHEGWMEIKECIYRTDPCPKCGRAYYILPSGKTILADRKVSKFTEAYRKKKNALLERIFIYYLKAEVRSIVNKLFTSKVNGGPTEDRVYSDKILMIMGTYGRLFYIDEIMDWMVGDFDNLEESVRIAIEDLWYNIIEDRLKYEAEKES